MSASEYEMVIGLEVHVELKTKTKIFCGCPTAFGAPPNTQCCPVCTGMPGALPVLNGQVVEYAIKAGLATNCQIAHVSRQDRKHYFYPDLPKAYQISQYDLPLCRDGWLEVETEEGRSRVGITRIHIEEDAGKLVHLEGKGTLVDCNRCGVPLIEIVSEPEIFSPAQARAYLQKLRALMLYTGISDCKMNEGSMRCDVNLSVRRRGELDLGTRAEIKNLNSFQSVERAIEYEFARQAAAVENGEAVVQETRRYDQNTGRTFPMRGKEEADDYRYFPDPDLPPIEVGEELQNRLAAEIPTLPDARKAEYVARYGLTSYAAEQLNLCRELADYFEAAASVSRYPRLCANLILNEALRLLPPAETEIPVRPERLAETADLLGNGVVNSSACRRLMQLLWERDADPKDLVEREHLAQISDEIELTALAQEAILEQPEAAQSYRAGKAAALQALVGRVMKKTGRRCNPARVQELLKRLLEEA